MAEPTLTAIFGANAVQTLETLTLTKADFADVNLTANANNTGEALLTAIILKAEKVLTATAQDTNPDQSISFEEGISSLPVRDGVSYRRNQRVINFDKEDSQSAIIPNDY